MKAVSVVVEGFARWIDSVADSVVSLHDRFSSPRAVALVEGENKEFMLLPDRQAPDVDSIGPCVQFIEGRFLGADSNTLATTLSGSRVALILQPDRFLVQSIELPRGATEFLDGVVRIQLDQLTPWSSADAAYGWSEPTDVGPDRISIKVAATALEWVSPYVQAIAAAGARSVGVFLLLANADKEAEDDLIKVLEMKAMGAVSASRIRKALLVAFLGSGLTAAAAVAAGVTIGASFDAQQADYAGRIASARRAATSFREAASVSAAAALVTLERRKHDVAPAVIVLDRLSQILPDHTYITGLRIEDDKVQLDGLTRDAPSLIGLIEKSGRFARATFFAPTTRSPSEPGERFHIEGHILSQVSPRS